MESEEKKPGWGGKRERAGRKPKVASGTTDPYLLRAEHEARLAEYKADLAGMDVSKRQRNLYEKNDVDRALSIIIATLAESMRSIPDRAERDFNLSSKDAEALEDIINDQLENARKEILKLVDGEED